jgi:hypothetical protein
VEGDGDGGGQLGSGVKERALVAYRLACCGKADPRGGITTPTERRTVATGGAACSGGNYPEDQLENNELENHVRRVLQ